MGVRRPPREEGCRCRHAHGGTGYCKGHGGARHRKQQGCCRRRHTSHMSHDGGKRGRVKGCTVVCGARPWW